MAGKDDSRKFEFESLLRGRTEIERISKLNVGTVVSISAQSFHHLQPEAQSAIYGVDTESRINNDDAAATFLVTDVQLPHGATVTGVIVYGSDSTNDWTMRRTDLVTGVTQTEMAGTTVNTEDTSISDGVIDNNNYQYIIFVSGMEQNDLIHGARIIFTI